MRASGPRRQQRPFPKADTAFSSADELGPAAAASPRTVAASLVLWKTPERLWRACLTALAKQILPIRAIAVFVNDDDGTVSAQVRSALSDIPEAQAMVENSPLNLGYATGHNRLLGALFAEPALGIDAVVVLNPDLIASPTMLVELAGFVSSATGPVLAGPVLELADPHTLNGEGRLDTCGIVWDRWGRHYDDQHGRSTTEMATQPTQVDGISGACMLVSRAAYERVVNETGEFFDGHFIAYREDAELGVRAALVGVESWVVPSAAALHVRGLRGTQRGISVHVDRLGVRNRFLIKIKLGRYRPGRPLAAAARDLLVVLGVLVKEWSSIPGLVDAWKLRHVMREKHRRLEEVVHSRSDVF